MDGLAERQHNLNRTEQIVHNLAGWALVKVKHSTVAAEKSESRIQDTGLDALARSTAHLIQQH